MKFYERIICIIAVIFIGAKHYEVTPWEFTKGIVRSSVRPIYRHLRRYRRLYSFLLGKIFAIAMLVIGGHCMVAHFNKVLPFGIVSDDMALWFIWAYTGWFIGGSMIAWGIMKLFEHTINRWLKTL